MSLPVAPAAAQLGKRKWAAVNTANVSLAKCMMLLAAPAASKPKCPSSPLQAKQYTAAIASKPIKATKQ